MHYRLTFILFLLFLQSAWAEDCHEVRAAFDVGSGATKMKVYSFDKCQNKIIKQIEEVDGQLCEVHRQVPYKEDLKESNKIQSKTIDVGISIISEFKEIAKKCGAIKFAGVATSAFRLAKNGKRAVEKLNNKTGVSIYIISQQEEAILGFNGAISKADNLEKTESVCVWDIGGSSMQIVCSTDGLEKKVFLGNLAAVPFKNHLIENKSDRSHHELRTANPVSARDYSNGLVKTKRESIKIQDILGNSLKISTVLGIGGVHYYDVSKVIEKEEFTADDISDEVLSKIGMSDEELGGGKYVDSSISNLILVEGLMRNLQISRVKTLKVNLTEGLVSSPKYWK